MNSTEYAERLLDNIYVIDSTFSNVGIEIRNFNVKETIPDSYEDFDAYVLFEILETEDLVSDDDIKIVLAFYDESERPVCKEEVWLSIENFNGFSVESVLVLDISDIESCRVYAERR